MSKFLTKLLGKATGESKREKERQIKNETKIASLPDAELQEDDIFYRQTAHHGLPAHSAATCYDSVQGLFAGESAVYSRTSLHSRHTNQCVRR